MAGAREYSDQGGIFSYISELYFASRNDSQKVIAELLYLHYLIRNRSGRRLHIYFLADLVFQKCPAQRRLV